MTDFEDRLRTWGEVEARTTGPTPAVRRPRRRWVPVAAAAAVLVAVGGVTAVLSGSGDRADHPVAPPATVPWKPLERTGIVVQQPSPTPTISAPDCVADDLTLTYGDSNGLTGAQIQQSVVVATARTCRLDAEITAISAIVNGRRVDIPKVRGALAADTSDGVITPTKPGFLALSYNLLCEGNEPRPPEVELKALRLTVLGHSLAVQSGSEPPGGSPTLGVIKTCSPGLVVSRLGVPPVEPTSFLPLPLGGLQVSITAPATVKAGSVLEYVVTLANPTDEAIELSPCPSYVESMPQAKESYQLNCIPGLLVPAHGSVPFDMRLNVPEFLEPPTELTLTWALEVALGNSTSPMAATTITVR